MGDITGIGWTDHTFNPWHGCTRVSPGCDNCYAATFSKRTGRVEWGDDAERWFPSEAYWRHPVRWNAAADAEGRRHRVFCASMADVFEDRPELVPHRERLFDLIETTPWLDWQLLTKRPENVEHLAARRLLAELHPTRAERALEAVMRWCYRAHLDRLGDWADRARMARVERRVP